MAELAVPEAEPGEAQPEERGTLDVRQKALVRIAEGAALHVPGTTTREGNLGGLVRSRLPHADVRIEGGRARVRLDVAVPWPARTSEVAARVRDRVRLETQRIAGVSVPTVDVTVHVVTDDDETTRRVE